MPRLNVNQRNAEIAARQRAEAERDRLKLHQLADQMKLWEQKAAHFNSAAFSDEQRLKYLNDQAWALTNWKIKNEGATLRHLELSARAVAESGVRDILASIQANLSDEFRWLEIFTRQFGNLIKNRDSRMQQAFQQVALAGKKATIAAYHEKGVGPYRFNDSGSYKRYSNGVMRTLLNSDSWYRVTPEGILWILPPAFDVAAKQWYRLNFGAAPAPQKGIGSVTMRFFGQNIGRAPTMDDFSPSKAFFLPRGVWSPVALAKTPKGGKGLHGVEAGTPSTGQFFYPAGAMGTGDDRFLAGSQRKVTKGIVGGRFLDAGFRTIAQQMPVAMEVLFRELATDAANSAGKKGAGKFDGGQGVNWSKKIAQIEDLHRTMRSSKNTTDNHLAKLHLQIAQTRKGFGANRRNFDHSFANLKQINREIAKLQTRRSS